MFKVVRQMRSHRDKLSLFSPNIRRCSVITSLTTPELRVKRNQLLCEEACIDKLLSKKKHIKDQIMKVQAELDKREPKDQPVEYSLR